MLCFCKISFFIVRIGTLLIVLADPMASLEVVPSTQDLEAAVETQMYDEDKDGHLRAFKNTFSQVQDTFKDESMAPEVTPPVEGHQPEVTAPVEGPPVEQVPEVAPPVEQVQATQEGESQVPPGQEPQIAETGGENENNSDFETQTSCRKCGASHPLLDMVTRNPEEHWCKSCNAVCTALRRHLQWPPQEFQSLSSQEQQQFWIEAGRTKQEGSACFKYERIRDVLITNLTQRKITMSKRAVGGKFKPLGVLRAKGYPLPENFEANAPREWSDSLACWTYLVAEVQISEAEVRESVEGSILQSERLVKKRKKGLTDVEKAATASLSEGTAAGPVIMDLISDESGGENNEEDDKKKRHKTEKQRLAAEKRAQEKADKAAAKEVQKEKAKEDRKILTENRKWTTLASKMLQPLTLGLKKGEIAEKDAKDRLDPSNPELVAFLAALQDVSVARKSCHQCLQVAAKATVAAMDPLPFANEKQANQLLRNLTNHINAIKVKKEKNNKK